MIQERVRIITKALYESKRGSICSRQDMQRLSKLVKIPSTRPVNCAREAF